MRNKKKVEPDLSVGEILSGSLTKQQIIDFLNVLFKAVDVTQYIDRLKKIDPDMADTIKRVLALESGEVVHHRIASTNKVLEYWDSLWGRWGDEVFEVGDEDGKYAVQDEHWEPPYFDGYALASDLDEIAKDMVTLIDDVFDIVKEPDLFYKALEEIDTSIFAYPEWMGVGGDEGCVLGKNATHCVLKWLWKGAQSKKHTGTDFLNSVYKLEDKLKEVYLNNEESISFFANLPDTVCREIYEQFRNKDNKKLDDIYSKWHKINHIYEQKFDSSKYIQTCRKHLSENWQYGKPLIDDAIAKGDYKEADSLLEQTFMTYLDTREKNIWYPETSLLLTKRRYYHADDNEEISELLELWNKVSKKLGNTLRSTASKMQSIIYLTPENWDKVVPKYKELRTPETEHIIDSLFSQWQTEMARRSIHYKISSDTWIHWLIESELDVKGKKEWFHKKLEVWLDSLKKDGKLFKKQWKPLARLTKDLPDSSDLQKLYPGFYEVVLQPDSKLSQLDKMRRNGLKKMETGIYISIVIDIWKNNLHLIVPDPSDSGGHTYIRNVEWMKVLHKLSRDNYEKLLSEWHLTHGLKRNLWKEMRKQQLPV